MNVIYYLPVFKDFLWDTLEQMRLDNVQYFEYRGQLHGVSLNEHVNSFLEVPNFPEFTYRYSQYEGMSSGIDHNDKEQKKICFQFQNSQESHGMNNVI